MKKTQFQLFKAIVSGDTQTVKYMIIHNKTPVANWRDPKGYTPLWWAIMYEKLEMVRLFVENGADINNKVLLLAENKQKRYQDTSDSIQWDIIVVYLQTISTMRSLNDQREALSSSYSRSFFLAANSPVSSPASLYNLSDISSPGSVESEDGMHFDARGCSPTTESHINSTDGLSAVWNNSDADKSDEDDDSSPTSPASYMPF